MTWDILKASRLLRACLIQKKDCLDIPCSVHVSDPAWKMESCYVLVRCEGDASLCPLWSLLGCYTTLRVWPSLPWEWHGNSLHVCTWTSKTSHQDSWRRPPYAFILPTPSHLSVSNLFLPLVSFLPGATYSHCHHHYYYWPAVQLGRNTFREQFPFRAHIFEGFWSGQTPASLNWAHAGPLALSVSSWAFQAQRNLSSESWGGPMQKRLKV